jgi:kynurenine formamidase
MHGRSEFDPREEPVHNHLLIEQGMQIGQIRNLQELAREKACQFCDVACTNKINSATAGFTMCPIAIR